MWSWAAQGHPGRKLSLRKLQWTWGCRRCAPDPRYTQVFKFTHHSARMQSHSSGQEESWAGGRRRGRPCRCPGEPGGNALDSGLGNWRARFRLQKANLHWTLWPTRHSTPALLLIPCWLVQGGLRPSKRFRCCYGNIHGQTEERQPLLGRPLLGRPDSTGLGGVQGALRLPGPSVIRRLWLSGPCVLSLPGEFRLFEK